jgi:hypothetical protein
MHMLNNTEVGPLKNASTLLVTAAPTISHKHIGPVSYH